ncbi:hypothetical protein FRC01_011407 [Tulasnella sp. 417]|nr:hypothetical protein FRC01_011407 [Tulasnella sp. 417]
MASQAQQISNQFVDLPPELHEHISIFLPSSSIPSLIRTNRYIQPIYEDILYRHINLYNRPLRSKALLNTFMLRPNLALIVYSLDIDFEWCPMEIWTEFVKVPNPEQARINALASAKNIKSLGVSGVAWLRRKDMKQFRDIISRMKLESLRIYEFSLQVWGNMIKHKEELFANFWVVLQGQPLLRELLIECIYSVLPSEIQSSYMENLRTLKTDVGGVSWILPAVGDRLESLEILNWSHRNHSELVASISGSMVVRGQIRKLGLTMRWELHCGWNFDLGKVLELFPNVESLVVIGAGGLSIRSLPLLWEIHLEKLASQISQSRNLVRLEMPLEFEGEGGEVLGGLKEELLLNLKRSCPSLQTLVTPGRQEWVFLPSEENGSGAFQVASTTDEPVTQDCPRQLLSLPVELHEHISIFLLTSSILNLISTNRYLRSIYEAILYRCINLDCLPNRSIGLLEAFKLRPDRALIVHTLHLDLRLFGNFSPTRSGSPAYAPIKALGLARNITSLAISGLSWIPDERSHAVKEAISRMELKSLRIKESGPSPSFDHPNREEEVIANLRQVLQAQPRLQNLDLEFKLFRMKVAKSGNFRFGIQKSDVPSLRTLGTRASTVVPLLKAIAGDQLESLTISSWKQRYHNSLVSSLANLVQTSQNIRRLRVSMLWTVNEGWGFDFGEVLELFPNTESLVITVFLSLALAQKPQRLDADLHRIASQIPHSSKILKIEISLEVPSRPRKILVAHIPEEVKLILKRSCPSLEAFIDPAGQEWRFFPIEGGGSSGTFRVVKMGQLHAGDLYFATGDWYFPKQDIWSS